MAAVLSSLITADDLAEILKVTRRHVCNLEAMGLIPRSIKLNTSRRWNAAEIEAWLQAGAPPRAEWEARDRNGTSAD